MKALVVIGSANSERPYGLISGRRVAQALSDLHWDVRIQDAARPAAVFLEIAQGPNDQIVVPVGFGVGIEDGAVYSMARMLKVPCAGPNPTTGTLALDKALFAQFVAGGFADSDDVDTPRSVIINSGDAPAAVRTRIETLDLPLIVKPNFGGSSAGLAVAETYAAAVAAAARLLQTEPRVLVQNLVLPSREISVTVLDTAAGPRILPIVELMRETVLGEDEKFGVGARDRHVVPAPLDPAVEQRVHEVVLKLHDGMRACGLTRFDILLVDRRICLLEANAIPGLLPESIACDAALAVGISFGELAEQYALSALLPRHEAAVTAVSEDE